MIGTDKKGATMITAQAALQARIDAEQEYATLVYGLRTAGAGPASPGREQLIGAISVAERLLGRYVSIGEGDSPLKQAKRIAAERVVEAKAAVKAFGTLRQLRLAIADGGTELAVAA